MLCKKDSFVAEHFYWLGLGLFIVLPKIDLNTLKALISRVDLVIGNDTGPTHMAWALNIPSITIFGNTPAYRNAYETKINKSIESKIIFNFSVHLKAPLPYL
jgi:ADP-heptose:LPS heptosyltransferase